MNFKFNYPLILAIFLGLLASSGLLFFLQFRTALTQEKDTVAIFKALFFMELKRADAAKVNANPQRLIIRNNDGLKSYMKHKGWTWVDQMGSFIAYRKGNEDLAATCEMYSRSYMICELTKVP
jgi:hypothetical protein